MAMTTREWVDFFEKAGIPSNEAATYALIFTQNRIQKNMLADLNKEYLKDMGISLLGDVIAILKHAKHVHENNVRVGLLENTVVPDELPEQDTANPAGGTTAKQLMDFYNQKYKEAEECLKVVMKAMPSKEKPVYNAVVKKEPIEVVEKDTNLSLPARRKSAPKPEKEVIFKRLEDVTSTTVETSTTKKTYSVFSRLGDLSSLPAVVDPLDSPPKEPVVIRKSAVRADLGIRKEITKKNPAVKEKDFLKANSLKLLKITTQFSDEEDLEMEETGPVKKPTKQVEVTRCLDPVVNKKRPISFNRVEERIKISAELPSKKVRFGAISTKVIDDSQNATKQPVFLHHSIVPKRAERKSNEPSKSNSNLATRRNNKPAKPVSKMVADTIRPKQSSVRARIGNKPSNNILDRLG